MKVVGKKEMVFKFAGGAHGDLQVPPEFDIALPA